MGAPKPTEVLAEVRKDLRELKNKELSARMALTKEEWQRDYDRIKNRTLRGRKDVEVTFEIDADDLEYLGYHHERDCNAASYDDEDVINEGPDRVNDRRALLDWHDEAHGLTLWASCPYEPCKILTDEFRSTP